MNSTNLKILTNSNITKKATSMKHQGAKVNIALTSTVTDIFYGKTLLDDPLK
jgi:hypothetical protein